MPKMPEKQFAALNELELQKLRKLHAAAKRAAAEAQVLLKKAEVAGAEILLATLDCLVQHGAPEDHRIDLYTGAILPPVTPRSE